MQIKYYVERTKLNSQFNKKNLIHFFIFFSEIKYNNNINVNMRKIENSKRKYN